MSLFKCSKKKVIIIQCKLSLLEILTILIKFKSKVVNIYINLSNLQLLYLLTQLYKIHKITAYSKEIDACKACLANSI